MLESPASRFARLFEAMSLRVEQPAVVAAANAALLNFAVVERRPAMAASAVQQTRSTPTVAKQYQILAERAYASRRIGGVLGQCNRVPVPAQELSHRRTAPDPNQIRFAN